MTTKFFPFLLFLALLRGYCFIAEAQQPDDWIKGLNLPGVTITAVEQVPAGKFTPPGQKNAIEGLPAFVRVALVSRPTPQSYIRIEVWLPQGWWNGRFVGTGNGGGAGRINYDALASGVKHSYAVANTDMGTSPHVDSLANKPERWADFGYRATHEMTVAAKAVIEKYYQRPPRYSYFIGCSTGGQQALMTAQRYPSDYNGILAGAPANNRTHLHSMFLWKYREINEKPGNQFTRQQINSITRAVLKANVGKDGGYSGDNFLTDPRMATLDLNELDSLTQEQKNILKKIYSGPVNPATGEYIYTSVPLGSEAAGSGLLEQQDKRFAYQFYPFRWVFGPDFDPMTFDFNKDMARVDSVLAPVLNANDPNLKPFKATGGKLLMYTGAADPLVPFQDAVNYYERVVATQGSLDSTQVFFRYFVIPGMWHCSGGPGAGGIGQYISDLSEPGEYNIFIALIRWVEKGIVPEHIIATAYKGNGDMLFQTPVYPYPLFPHLIKGKKPRIPTSYRGAYHERGNVVIPAPRYSK
jgi:feruloyl esterase